LASPAAYSSCKKQPATPNRRRENGAKAKPPMPLRLLSKLQSAGKHSH
jgi:hypothetical protein